MDEQQGALAIKSVRQYVWSGFHDPDEIVEMIDEAVFRPGEIDHGWLRGQIEQAFHEKQAEEASRPAITDWDCHDQVFTSLERHGILSLQHAGASPQHPTLTNPAPDGGPRRRGHFRQYLPIRPLNLM